MPAELTVLVIDTAAAAPVRSVVGPVAWFVLESLAGSAVPGQREVEVAAGTRQLSAAVSLSKDAVARALRRLGDAGVVVRVDHRDSRSGRFGSTVYVVDLVVAGLTVEHRFTGTGSVHPSPPSTATPPLQPSLPPVNNHQLSLLH